MIKLSKVGTWLHWFQGPKSGSMAAFLYLGVLQYATERQLTLLPGASYSKKSQRHEGMRAKTTI